MLRHLLQLLLQQQPVSGPPRAVPSTRWQQLLPLQQQRWQQWRPPLPQQRACCPTCGPCWRWQRPCSSTRAAGDTYISAAAGAVHFSASVTVTSCRRLCWLALKAAASRKFTRDATTLACKQGPSCHNSLLKTQQLGLQLLQSCCGSGCTLLLPLLRVVGVPHCRPGCRKLPGRLSGSSLEC